MSNPSPLWYTARGAGVVLLLLLTSVVVLGILVSVRWTNQEWSKYLVQAAHRYVSLLTLVFLGLHIVTAVLDPFARLQISDALIPFTAAYRPIWLGLGVVAAELLVALVVSSLLRARLPFRVWRMVHWLAYISWPVALLHGVGTGTDTRTWWGMSLVVLCIVAVLVALGIRIAQHQKRSELGIILGPMLGVATIAFAMWAVGGPLQSGWARASGTPSDLLAAAAVSGPSTANSSSSGSTATAATIPAGLQDQLQGNQTQTNSGLAAVQFSDITNPNIVVTISDTGELTLRSAVPPWLLHWVRMDRESLPTGIEMPSAGHNSRPTALTVS